jgi:hypothetical protein
MDISDRDRVLTDRSGEISIHVLGSPCTAVTPKALTAMEIVEALEASTREQ